MRPWKNSRIQKLKKKLKLKGKTPFYGISKQLEKNNEFYLKVGQKIMFSIPKTQGFFLKSQAKKLNFHHFQFDG